MSHSPLATYTKLSPNCNKPRNHKIDTITIHCYVGQVTVERAGKGFADPKRKASCNYAEGFDGRVALILPEEGDADKKLDLKRAGAAPFCFRRQGRLKKTYRKAGKIWRKTGKIFSIRDCGPGEFFVE